METFVLLTVTGLGLGAMYFLIASGLSLIYGTTGLVNFAHGELVTLGALLAWFFNASVDGPEATLVVAGLLAVILSGAFGGGLELVLWRPMVRRRSGLIARMLVSIGLALFLRYWFEILFGANTSSYRQDATQEGIDFGPLNLPAKSYFIMAIALVALLAVGIGLQRTRLGTAIRAVADERDLAASSGIDVRRVIRLALGLRLVELFEDRLVSGVVQAAGLIELRLCLVFHPRSLVSPCQPPVNILVAGT